jgi:hypothetical protein
VVSCDVADSSLPGAEGPSGKEKDGEKIFSPWGSAQPLEKAQSGQENPRKSKPWGKAISGKNTNLSFTFGRGLRASGPYRKEPFEVRGFG